MSILIERQELLELFDTETIHEAYGCVYEYARNYEQYTLYLFNEVLADCGSICLKDRDTNTIIFELFFHPNEKVTLIDNTVRIYTAKKALRATVTLKPMASLDCTL